MQIEIVRNQCHAKHDQVTTAAEVWEHVHASLSRRPTTYHDDPPPARRKPELEPMPVHPDRLGTIIEWDGHVWRGGFYYLVRSAYPQRYMDMPLHPDASDPIANRPHIREIITVVAEACELRVGDLISERRTAHIVLPRQVAMALAKHLTLRSLPEIGRRFGGRDHTTVLHAVRKMQPLIDAVAAQVPTGATLEIWVSAALEIAPTMDLMTTYRRRKNGQEVSA